MVTASSYAEGSMGTWQCPPTLQATGCVTAGVEEAAGRALGCPRAHLHQGCAATLSIFLLLPSMTLSPPWSPHPTAQLGWGKALR